MGRANLIESNGAGSSQRGQETNHTAELDNQGLLQMQRQVIRDQDTELEDMERTIGSTKVNIVGNAFCFLTQAQFLTQQLSHSFDPEHGGMPFTLSISVMLA